MKSVEALRKAIFAPLMSKGLTARGPALLDYYPPDVDCFKLAKQDPLLNNLNLVDVRKEISVERERKLEERGKFVRVSGKIRSITA